MITTVTFDLWNTLIQDTRENGEIRTGQRISRIKDQLNKHQFQITKLALEHGYQKCIDHCKNIKSQGLDLGFPEQIYQFLELSSPDIYAKLPFRLIQMIENIYSEIYLEYPSKLHADTHDLLVKLKSSGYKIALISNTSMTPGITFRKFLFDNKIAPLFDALIFSDELQSSKPSTYLFEHALQKLNSSPFQTVHVGDQLETDVLGANLSGINSLLVNKDITTDEFVNIVPDKYATDLSEVFSEIESLNPS
jgi:putative hydrolase of the HAD superfamily